mmetsp:Transcript_43548/g.113395  ORF Transcript_43548/g.113395 Transcript_43548/m.113395 type:complete len:109 (+) Transcript_43548:3090-3416(+)
MQSKDCKRLESSSLLMEACSSSIKGRLPPLSLVFPLTILQTHFALFRLPYRAKVKKGSSGKPHKKQCTMSQAHGLDWGKNSFRVTRVIKGPSTFIQENISPSKCNSNP